MLAVRHMSAFAALLRGEFTLDLRGHHGPSHWARVSRNGRVLCQREPRANPRVVALFALLHDLRRENEEGDPDHGPRAAAFIAEIAREHLTLDPGELDRLREACIGHSDGETSDDPTIAACWDADRLDLGRVGKRLDARFLSLPAAREPALMAWAHRRAVARRDRGLW